MPLSATIQLDVPELPDASVWFANAAAWHNYWRDIGATVVFDPAETDAYIAVPFDDDIEYVAVDVNGDIHNLIPQAMFESLKARLDAVEASYAALRLALVEAGFTTD